MEEINTFFGLYKTLKGYWRQEAIFVIILVIYLSRKQLDIFFKWVFKIIATVEHQKQLEESAAREEAIKYLSLQVLELKAENESLKHLLEKQEERHDAQIKEMQNRHDQQINEMKQDLKDLRHILNQK